LNDMNEFQPRPMDGHSSAGRFPYKHKRRRRGRGRGPRDEGYGFRGPETGVQVNAPRPFAPPPGAPTPGGGMGGPMGPAGSAAPQAFAPAVAAAAPNPNRRVGTLGGGVLDLNPDGYGFLRSIERHFEPSPDDLFVPTALVRRYGLRLGSYIEGTIGPPRGRGGNYAVERIDRVDGLDPEAAFGRPLYKSLVSIDPAEQYMMEDGSGDLTLRVIDLLCPIGKGQRALITASPRSGKTIILQKIAKRIMEGYPDTHLMVLLIDERPEEATDFSRAITHGEVIFSTNDEPPSHGIRVAELAAERAKRLLESGRDVFILLDSLTRLGRNYNAEIKSGGRTMSGGLDSRTMEKPRAMFGAARNVEGGGSLTICATALVETGSRMDEVIFEEFKGTGNMELVLDRKLAERRVFPAIEINKSATRREERLIKPDVLDRMWTLRRVLNKMNPIEAMELLLQKLEKTETNAEFLSKFIIRE
jgi:transcription termination factor Rho